MMPAIPAWLLDLAILAGMLAGFVFVAVLADRKGWKNHKE